MAKTLKTSDFQPLWDNIIVRPIKIEEKGDGFVRPQSEEDKSEVGEIIAIGHAIDNSEWAGVLKVGDIVLFNKYSSTKVDLGRELIVRAEDVVAVQHARHANTKQSKNRSTPVQRTLGGAR